MTPTAPHHAAGSTSRAVGPLGSNPGHAHREGTIETEPLSLLSLNTRRGTEGELGHRDPRTHFQEWWPHRHGPVAKLTVCWLGATDADGNGRDVPRARASWEPLPGRVWHRWRSSGQGGRGTSPLGPGRLHAG